MEELLRSEDAKRKNEQANTDPLESSKLVKTFKTGSSDAPPAEMESPRSPASKRAAHWEQEGSKWRKAEQTASSSSTATRAYVKMFRDKRTAEEAGLDEADKSHAMMMGELNSLCESLGTSPVHIKEMFNPGNFADKATNLGLQVVPRTSEPAGTSICNLIARPHGNSGKLSNRSYLLDHPCVHPSRKFIH